MFTLAMFSVGANEETDENNNSMDEATKLDPVNS